MRKVLNHWRPHYDPKSKQTFNLDHLDALKVDIIQKPSGNKPACIPCRIKFGHHCFTDDKKTDECGIYREPNKEGRPFCKERHELSEKYLRDLVIKSFSNGNSKCFKDQKYYLSYLLIKGLDFHGRKVSYEVYFIIDKSKTDNRAVNVVIDSAFIRQSRNLRRIIGKSISVGVLANNKLKGKK